MIKAVTKGGIKTWGSSEKQRMEIGSAPAGSESTGARLVGTGWGLAVEGAESAGLVADGSEPAGDWSRMSGD